MLRETEGSCLLHVGFRGPVDGKAGFGILEVSGFGTLCHVPCNRDAVF